MKISYNVQIAMGKSNPETPIFIDATKVDLTNKVELMLNSVKDLK